MCHGGHYSTPVSTGAWPLHSVLFRVFFFFSNEVDSVAPMRYCPTANHHDLLPAAAAVWLSLRSFTTATEEQQCDAGREKKHGEDEGRDVTCGWWLRRRQSRWRKQDCRAGSSVPPLERCMTPIRLQSGIFYIFYIKYEERQRQFNAI